MELINLKSLNLTSEKFGDIIKFLVQRRGITAKKLLSTIKQNLKRKNNKDLASKSQQKLVKKQQELVKTQLALIKSQQKLIKSIKSQQKLTKQTKSQRELIKSQQKLKKQRRLIKSQQTKEIRNHLYNKLDNNNNSNELDNNNSNKLDNNKLDNNDSNNELDNNNSNELDNNNNNKLDNNNNSNELDNNNSNELDNNSNNSNKLDNNDDFIENVRDLFNIVNYEPILIKTGFDGNYLEYRSEGNNLLRFEEYINLIKPYLNDLINNKKDEGEWKLQLSAEISFVSQKPGSDETRVMYTRSICEDFMSGSETEEVAEKLIISLLQKYQDNLQNKMKCSDFIFNGVNYLFYDLNRTTISKGGSYIGSPKWLLLILKKLK